MTMHPHLCKTERAGLSHAGHMTQCECMHKARRLRDRRHDLDVQRDSHQQV